MIDFKFFKKEVQDPLRINTKLVEYWLVEFLKRECIIRRHKSKAVLGLSGGVDSSVVAYLCAKAFGPENVYAICMPYKISSLESITHADLVIDALGIKKRTLNITDMVDGYVSKYETDMSPNRIGNVCSRCRMTILFDQSAKLEDALPIGTGNKTERLFGYFTWHADDSPPINPLGDLFKVQVWKLAAELGVPEVIIKKPASADLIKGQTDEGDFGINYHNADPILYYIVRGFTKQMIVDMGFISEEVNLVWNKVKGSHWKRHLPTVAMISPTAIGESYLRPVDY